jgi:hypothetical protein
VTGTDSPDRDPLIDELLRLFSSSEKVDRPSPFLTSGYAAAMLTGVPIEQVAESLNRRYLTRTSRYIAQLRGSGNPAEWDPVHWVVVCSPYLFHGLEEIEGVRVMHTCPLPWSVLLIRSPEWLDAQAPLTMPIRFLDEDASIVAAESAERWDRLRAEADQLRPPGSGPWVGSPNPTSFIKITGA